MNSSLQELLQQRRQKAARRKLIDFEPPRLARPLIIVSAPRAGSTLLFETLARFPELWTIGEESHEIIEGIPELHPTAHGYASNRLSAADATPEVRDALYNRFARQLQDRDGRHLIDLPPGERPPAVRMAEKTPKNALRIPFLRALFPDAHFLFLFREPAANISSMMEGWQSRRFIAYRSLPDWPHGPWSFLLTPGWESLRHSSIAQIAAYQWQAANATIVEELAGLPRSSWSLVRYPDLLNEPRRTMQRIAQATELTWDAEVEQRVSQALPLSGMTVSAPSAEKWRKNAAQIEPLLSEAESVVRRVDALEEAS